MRDNKSPFQLVQMPGVIVERLAPGAPSEAQRSNGTQGPNEIEESNEIQGPKQFKQSFTDRYPLFSWF